MILSSKKVIWKAEGIRASEITQAFRKLTGISSNVLLDVDVLFLYHRARYYNNHTDALQRIAMKFKKLAQEGFHVTGIIDGDTRPDCKRSSWERVSKVEFKKLNGHFSRSTAMALGALLKSDHNLTPKEEKEMLNQIKLLNKESKSCEQKPAVVVPFTLKEDLEDMIFNICTSDAGYSGHVNPSIIKAKYQADSMMIYRINSGLAHICFTGDTDAAMQLGPDHFYIRSFENMSKKKGVEDMAFEIAGAAQSKMDELKKLVPREKIIWTDVEYPVFDSPSPTIRSLVAIALGCDVFKGVKNLGPKKLHDFFLGLPKKSTIDEIEKALIGLMVSKTDMTGLQRVDVTDKRPPVFDREVILALSSAILNEAVIEQDDTDGVYQYMHGQPEEVPMYVHYYSQSGMSAGDNVTFDIENPECEVDKVYVSKIEKKDEKKESVVRCDGSEMSSFVCIDSDDEKSHTSDFVQVSEEMYRVESVSRDLDKEFELVAQLSDDNDEEEATGSSSKKSSYGVEEPPDHSSTKDSNDPDDSENSDTNTSHDSTRVPPKSSWKKELIEGTLDGMRLKLFEKVVEMYPHLQDKVDKDNILGQMQTTYAPLLQDFIKAWDKTEKTKFRDFVYQFTLLGRHLDNFISHGCFLPDIQPDNQEPSPSSSSNTDSSSKKSAIGKAIEASVGPSEKSGVDVEATGSSTKKSTIGETVVAAPTGIDVEATGSPNVPVKPIKLIPGPPTGYCNGIPGITQGHVYLEAEGTHFCFKCRESFCYTCGYCPSLLTTVKKNKGYHQDKNEPLCFPCYQTSCIVDGGNDVSREVAEMRKELRKLNVPTTNETLHHEVEDLFDFYMVNRQSQHERLSARYPLFSSKFFDDIKDHICYRGRLFSPDGFLNDHHGIKDNDVPMVVQLFAGIVRYKRFDESDYAAAVPGMVIEFANGSRAVNGLAHKVIKSAVRIAVDPKWRSFMDQDYCLFYHQCTQGDSIGIILENDVPATMKDQLYHSKIAFTVHNFLASQCECIASGMGTGDDRITCIHNLPLIVNLSLLLHRGIAKNFLHDLSTRWSADTEALLVGTTRYDVCREDILTLMEASSEEPQILQKAQVTENIIDMLKVYKETTARYKPSFSVPPESHELIPLRDFPVESSVTKKKRLMQEEPKSARNKKMSAFTATSKTTKQTHLDDIDESEIPPLEGRYGGPPRSNMSAFAATSTARNQTYLDNMDDSEMPPLEGRYGGPASAESVSLPPTVFHPSSPTAETNTTSFAPLIIAHQLTFDEHNYVDTAGRNDMPEHVDYLAYRALIGRLTNRNTTESRSLRNYWLTDDIINSYVKLLLEMDSIHNPTKRSHVFNTHFYFYLTSTIRGYDFEGVSNWTRCFNGRDIFSDLKHFVVPMNLGNTHWALTVVYFEELLIEYEDSFGLGGDEHTENVLQYLEDYARENNLPFDKSKWRCRNRYKTVPQQENSVDCGVFVLLNAYLTLRNIPLTYTQQCVTCCNTRKIIALSLLKREALPPITITNDARPRSITNQSSLNSKRDRDDYHDPKYDDESYENNKTVKRVREKLFERDTNESNTCDTFEPDYIKVQGFLQTVFGAKKVPTKYVGYKLIHERSLLGEQKLRDNHGLKAAEKIIKQKKTCTYFDYRKILIDVAKNKHQTNDLSLNTNGCENKKTNKKPTMTSNRKYGPGTVRTCSFPNCKTTSKDKVAFEKIPKAPKPIDNKILQTKRARDIGTYCRRTMMRKLALKSIGVKPTCSKEYRICSRHKKSLYSVKHTYPRQNKKDLTFDFTFTLPDSTVSKMPKKESEGMGEDRYKIQAIKDIPEDELKSLTMFSMVAMHIIEENKTRKKPTLNNTVRELMNIDDENVSKKLKLSSSQAPCVTRRKTGTIRSFDMTDAEIKSRTGFESKKLMLAFMGIVCNGCVKTMVQTTSKTLTFYEEWFLTFEMIWGRSWINQVSLVQEFHLNAERKNDIVDAKIGQILKCRNSWPRYATHAEDLSLRPEKWNGVIGQDERVIMHDTTGVPLRFKPTLHSSQKITWSDYYGSNYFKADVEVQPCGLIGTNPMWVAAISDTEYMIRENIFEEQQRFQNNDKINETVLPFLNILDRGYRLSAHALRCGNQTVRQPVFKNKDRRFTGNETLRSASCASVRSGNERAVRKAKLSGFIKKGLVPSENPKRLDNVWLAWGFMVNFMYESNV